MNYRKSDDGEDKLKKLGQIDPYEIIIKFFDEAAPQASSNSIRMRSFRKPAIKKNTTKFRVNTIGLYAFNGMGTVNTYIN